MPLLKKTAFGLLLAFAAGLAAAAGNTQIESFNQAKKTLEREARERALAASDDSHAS